MAAAAPERQLKRIGNAGYDGVMCAQPALAPAQWKDLLAEYGLHYVAELKASAATDMVVKLEEIHAYAPLLVNAHSGQDRMTFEEGCRFFDEVIRAEKTLGLIVAHETHRRRLLYAPWITAHYLKAFPDLRITADFSHWCVVCESLLDELDDLVELACSRTIHIHGRVGYEQGPQVADPRAPELAAHLQRFEQWWDAIYRARRECGAEWLGFDPEFGPPPYQHSLPYSDQPAADVWDICLWMANRQRQRWQIG